MDLPTFAIPFLIGGVGMVLSPAWYFYRGRHATYLLTDRRAIVDMSGEFMRRRSVPLGNITVIDMDIDHDDFGDLYFYRYFERYPSDIAYPRYFLREGFVAINGIRGVDGMLRSAIDNYKNSRTQ